MALPETHFARIRSVELLVVTLGDTRGSRNGVLSRVLQVQSNKHQNGK